MIIQAGRLFWNKNTKNQWNSIVNNDIYLVDRVDHNVGRFRHRSTYKLLMEGFGRKGELVWVARKRALTDNWLVWITELLDLDIGYKFRTEILANDRRFILTWAGYKGYTDHSNMEFQAGKFFYVLIIAEKLRKEIGRCVRDLISVCIFMRGTKNFY